jgi:hypothetical protein
MGSYPHLLGIAMGKLQEQEIRDPDLQDISKESHLCPYAGGLRILLSCALAD